MGLERQPSQQHVSSLGLLALNQLLLFVSVGRLLCLQSCHFATSSCPCDLQPQHWHTSLTCSCLVLLHCCSPNPSECSLIQHLHIMPTQVCHWLLEPHLPQQRLASFCGLSQYLCTTHQPGVAAVLPAGQMYRASRPCHAG